MFRTEWKTQYQQKGDTSQLARPSPNPRKGFVVALILAILLGVLTLSVSLYKAQREVLFQDRYIFYLENIARQCERHFQKHHPSGEWK